MRREIEQAGLRLRSPFDGLAASKLADRFRQLVRRALAAAKVREVYSVRDLRHGFAVRISGVP